MRVLKIGTTIATAALLGGFAAGSIAAPVTIADAMSMAANAGPTDDAMVTAKVKSALSTDKAAPASKINVKTEKGVVTLSGTAPDEETIRRILNVVSSIEGVTNIQNQLQVKPS